MDYRTIYVTAPDLKRLLDLVYTNIQVELNHKKLYEDLLNELHRAVIVEPTAVPADVITMNSRARLRDLDDGEIMEYTLVFPNDADIETGRVSVLAPIGTALIGYRAGDIIEWPVPEGVRRLMVEAVLYQPEASGDFHL